MVTNHAPRFAGRKWPDRQLSRSFVHIQKGLNHVIHKVSIGQSHQWMPATESIPNGESRIHLLVLSQRSYGHIVTTVLSVHITHGIRHHQCMIPCCIEILQLVFCTTLHLYFRKHFIPSSMSLLTDSIKVEIRHIVSQILASILCTNNRQTNFHDNLFFVSKRKDSLHIRTFQFTIHSNFLIIFYIKNLLNRLGELSHKINVLIVYPSQSMTHTGDFSSTCLLNRRVIDLFPIGYGVSQIQNNGCFLSTFKGISMHTGIGSSSQLGFDLFIKQFY